jgi:NitT/TauT family transport system permease protein
MKRTVGLLYALITIIIVLASWEAFVRLGHIREQILPGPTIIARTLWSARIPLLRHSLVTLMRTSIGFTLGVVVGVVLGVALVYWSWLNEALQPLLTALYCLPKSVVVPILLLWTGLGTTPAILTAISLAFFPILTNIIAGLLSIHSDFVDLLRLSGARKGQILWKVGIPNTLPYLFAAFKTAGPNALVGVIVSEMIAASNGLGYVIVFSGAVFNIPLMFAGIACLMLIGITLYGIAAFFEKRYAHWAFRGARV